MGSAIYSGVRAGGLPQFPTSFRWGYGWKYKRKYGVLTKEESIIADAMLLIFEEENKNPFEDQITSSFYVQLEQDGDASQDSD